MLKMASSSNNKDNDPPEHKPPTKLQPPPLWMRPRRAAFSLAQFACNVLDASSELGDSYGAKHIMGKPKIFPAYGFFSDCFTLRTFGKWWSDVPSGQVKATQLCNLPKILTNDYIVLEFEQYMRPQEISVYETFNPGAVVRIWACTANKTWVLLWEASELTLPEEQNTSRQFKPPIRKLMVPIKIIKLEFNHTLLKYYPQIDAVRMTGEIVSEADVTTYKNTSPPSKLRSQLLDSKWQDFQKTIDILNASWVEMQEVLSKTNTTVLAYGQPPKLGLGDMPKNILTHIFSYLDLRSLFRVGGASRLLHEVSKDPVLYKEINLSAYWYLCLPPLFTAMKTRAVNLNKLDLSRCSPTYGDAAMQCIRIIEQQNGNILTHLRLDGCCFFNRGERNFRDAFCKNLKDLSMRNTKFYHEMDAFLIGLVRMDKLERLDLYGSDINIGILTKILAKNPNLKYLAASCDEMDVVCQQLKQYNRELISLVVGGSSTMNDKDLEALSDCDKLEELDFGWSLRKSITNTSLQTLFTKCTRLRKLFINTRYAIRSTDLKYLVSKCPKMEQLTLMGMEDIELESYQEILAGCKHLKYFDISFSANIDDDNIAKWREQFTKVDIHYWPTIC